VKLKNQLNQDHRDAFYFFSLQFKGVSSEKDQNAVDSSINFLTSVLKCSKAIKESTKRKQLVFEIWNEVKKKEVPALLELIATFSSDEEFEKIMANILAGVKVGINVL